MRADNSRHLLAAARRRSEDARRRTVEDHFLDLVAPEEPAGD